MQIPVISGYLASFFFWFENLGGGAINHKTLNMINFFLLLIFKGITRFLMKKFRRKKFKNFKKF